SLPSNASRMAAWRSARAGTGLFSDHRLAHIVRSVRLVEQDRQRRHVRVPFDERGYGAESTKRMRVEAPDVWDDPRPVVVDQDRVTVHIVFAMAGQMDLAHRVAGQRVEIADRIEPEIRRRHEDVVDVAQQAAASASHDLSDELCLRYGGVTKAQVAGRIFDQEPAAERLLRLEDV